ncbi:unnamed protein product [Mycena citricolor]|uniref:Reverse transcriptase domain-containing protein n=1 Tax=Mycena citricolor TaxID=2018698 RepID=A0AAD2GUS9_9AGAR|nr:unnamed protein product [Mycena citricolor]
MKRTSSRQAAIAEKKDRSEREKAEREIQEALREAEKRAKKEAAAMQKAAKEKEKERIEKERTEKQAATRQATAAQPALTNQSPSILQTPASALSGQPTSPLSDISDSRILTEDKGKERATYFPESSPYIMNETQLMEQIPNGSPASAYNLFPRLGMAVPKDTHEGAYMAALAQSRGQPFQFRTREMTEDTLAGYEQQPDTAASQTAQVNGTNEDAYTHTRPSSNDPVVPTTPGPPQEIPPMYSRKRKTRTPGSAQRKAKQPKANTPKVTKGHRNASAGPSNTRDQPRPPTDEHTVQMQLLPSPIPITPASLRPIGRTYAHAVAANIPATPAERAFQAYNQRLTPAGFTNLTRGQMGPPPHPIYHTIQRPPGVGTPAQRTTPHQPVRAQMNPIQQAALPQASPRQPGGNQYYQQPVAMAQPAQWIQPQPVYQPQYGQGEAFREAEGRICINAGGEEMEIPIYRPTQRRAGRQQDIQPPWRLNERKKCRDVDSSVINSLKQGWSSQIRIDGILYTDQAHLRGRKPKTSITFEFGDETAREPPTETAAGFTLYRIQNNLQELKNATWGYYEPVVEAPSIVNMLEAVCEAIRQIRNQDQATVNRIINTFNRGEQEFRITRDMETGIWCDERYRAAERSDDAKTVADLTNLTHQPPQHKQPTDKEARTRQSEEPGKNVRWSDRKSDAQGAAQEDNTTETYVPMTDRGSKHTSRKAPSGIKHQRNARAERTSIPAGLSTIQKAVQETAQDSFTAALSAATDSRTTAQRATQLRSAPRPELFPIITPLRADRWEHWISKAGLADRYADIPDSIRHGFTHGITNDTPLERSFIPNNLASAIEHPEIINTYLENEINNGHISKGYELHELEKMVGFIRCSPVGCIQRDPPNGKWRMFNHHSYPRNSSFTSINATINKLDFPCSWGSFNDCSHIVAKAPSGAQASVFDVKSAFRIIPTRPEDRLKLAIHWNNRVHLDQVFSFGATSSPGVFGRLADLLVELLKYMEVEDILKWVDDFVFFRYPKSINENGTAMYSYDEKLFTELADDLGWPWEPKKHTPFAHTFTYNGFDWNLKTKEVTIPEKKKQKYLKKLEPWIVGFKATRKEAENIVGVLNHCALVVTKGRSRLVSIYRFVAAFNQLASPSIRHNLPEATANDIHWWRKQIGKPVLSRTIKPELPLEHDEIFVDASTSWGIGLVTGGRWLAWKYKEGWKRAGRNIGWGEMVAVELAARTITSQGARRKHYKLRSDNQGVVGALAAGKSYNTEENNILQHILELFEKFELNFTIEWIASKDNPADDPSRGVLSSKESFFTSHIPELPLHLADSIQLVNM